MEEKLPFLEEDRFPRFLNRRKRGLHAANVGFVSGDCFSFLLHLLLLSDRFDALLHPPQLHDLDSVSSEALLALSVLIEGIEDLSPLGYHIVDIRIFLDLDLKDSDLPELKVPFESHECVTRAHVLVDVSQVEDWEVGHPVPFEA